uniref:magnesium chelatase n=1 Tax=Boodleopsis pusilla TaxID=381415 RepID=A0A386AZI4_9CHLO|nr:Mg chelatase subunit e [Boodleopsis pusilla]AYC64823.1 Mg chelatase subunit e [Boodleopsis pusilla]
MYTNIYIMIWKNFSVNAGMNIAETKKDNSPDVRRPIFPFTAIVGQEEMKLSLILNVIDPKIGGVMIMGDRGTGKSTAVRALVDLLPDILVVSDDPFNSDPEDPDNMSDGVREKIQNNEPLLTHTKKIPMIDLPLGATEDRVCGTIDLEKALTEGVKAFEPGLLAQANRGILYVDEVNLLDDHLVDHFILIGSGNPEEGELRPQLLDRFGLHAQIGTVQDPELRVQIVEQRATFDASPLVFRQKYHKQQEQLTHLLYSARDRLKTIQLDTDLRIKISQVCATLHIDGLRGDIVTNRAAKALTCLEERQHVTPEDIFRVLPLCLRHRLRKDPLETIDSGEKVRETFQKIFG